MRGGLLLGAGVVLLLAVACGEDKAQYSYADSIGCLKGVGNGPDVSADDMDQVEKCLG